MSSASFKSGDKYRGAFKDGRPCGQGVMKYTYSIPGSNGSDYEEATYIGTWRAGKREGQGTMTWNDGTVFTGLWRNDMRYEGEQRFLDGTLYRGSFLNDKLHGEGKLLFSNGIIFSGSFYQGVASSVGKLLSPNGDIYYGQHRGFVREGQGKLITFNDHEYEGGWSNDKKNVYGRSVDRTTGDVYCGEYADGKRTGRGRFYHGAT